jgi:cupin fold WbuC family metalloprotein
MNNPSVEFFRATSVGDKLLSKLSAMRFSSSGTRRICLHESESSPLHVMLVESASGTSFPRHFHLDSDEVTVVVKGQMEIVLWDRGTYSSPTRLLLGPGEGESKVALVPKLVPHFTQPVGGNCIYLEVKLGPFKKDALVKLDS